MRIISEKRQKELDAMVIKKLRFVAKATYRIYGHYNTQEQFKKESEQAADAAEQAFYASDVLFIP